MTTSGMSKSPQPWSRPPGVCPLAGLTSVERRESYLALSFGRDDPVQPYRPPGPRRRLDNIWWHPGAWLIAVIHPMAALDRWTEICGKGPWSLACRQATDGLTIALQLNRAAAGGAAFEWHVEAPTPQAIVIDIDWRSGRATVPVARVDGRVLQPLSTVDAVRLSDDGTDGFAIGDGDGSGVVSALAIWPRGHLPRSARERLRRSLQREAGIAATAIVPESTASADTAFFMLDAGDGLEIAHQDRVVAWRHEAVTQTHFHGTSTANAPRLIKPNAGEPAAVGFAEKSMPLRYSILTGRQLDNIWHGDGAALISALALEPQDRGTRRQAAVLVDKGSWRIQVDRPSRQATLVLDKPGPAGQFKYSWPMPIDGQRHVLSVCWSAGGDQALAVRLDAEPVATFGEGKPSSLAYDGDDDFLIGNRGDGDRGLGGRIAMLGCWPLEALSDTDLADLEARFLSRIGG
jgi:hypothetical protein